MKRQATHVGVVRSWCQSLGVLTAVSITREEAEMKLAAYVPLLMQEFPDAAFTSESLNHVARACSKGFPTYAELVGALSAHWRASRPVLALPPPPPPEPRPPPTDEERAEVTRLAREAIAALRSTAQEFDRRREAVWAAQERRGVVPPPYDDAGRPRARHLSAELLDRINPLPNGRKRSDATSQASMAPANANGADHSPPAA